MNKWSGSGWGRALESHEIKESFIYTKHGCSFVFIASCSLQLVFTDAGISASKELLPPLEVEAFLSSRISTNLI
jgi:hypothetical protein